MIVKKLSARFINDKVLHHAETAYFATATISEPGFEFIIDRLPKTCSLQIVIGLDLPTNPKVLWRILNEYGGRVVAKVYLKNFFHPKVYAFDLPHNKRIAYIGSGNFTLGGFKDNEELSYQISAFEEVEQIKDWFNGYFRESIPLSKTIIQEYEIIYPSLKEREASSRNEKKQFADFVTGSFNWDNINLSNQYFTKEDYFTFENSLTHLATPDVKSKRVKVQNKLLDLNDALSAYIKTKKIHAHYDSNHIVSSLDPLYHHEHKVRGMWVAYGRSAPELDQYNAKHMDLIRLQVIIRHHDFGIWLMPGKQNSGIEDRQFFRDQMKRVEFREKFFNLIKGLDSDYWIEVGGEKREVRFFETADALWQHTSLDDLQYYFTIGRSYNPGDRQISETNIVSTIIKEFDKLFPLYRAMKDKSFER